MTLGFMMPLAKLGNGVPDMRGQLELAARVDALDFAALWVRDVPLFDPNFGDAGQIYDPWVWLGQLAARTSRITLSTAGLILPLRHPLHTAKAAFTMDVVSNGRFFLGGASGDRQIEYPAFGRSYGDRGANYREAVQIIRRVAESYPTVEGDFGRLEKLDLLPKPLLGRLPIIAIGSAQQSVQWIAEHMDAWMTYPRELPEQRKRLGLWNAAVAERAPGLFKPFAQPLFVDLTEDPDQEPSPIFLGFRLGRNRLIDYLCRLQDLGIHHVALQLLHNKRPASETVEELASKVLPYFASPSNRWDQRSVRSPGFNPPSPSD